MRHRLYSLSLSGLFILSGVSGCDAGSKMRIAVKIDQPMRHLGQQPTQEPIDVAFRVTNDSGESIRIMGVAPSCGENCCYAPKHSSPVVIPAYGNGEYVLQIRVGEPGPFVCQIPLYLDVGGLTKTIMTIQGVGQNTTAVTPATLGDGSTH